MTRSRILLLGLIASALAIAPTSSALAGGQHWSHGHAYHGGYHGAHWHGGGGYWRGGVWWPAAAAAAVVGTAAALVVAPFVAIGNAVQCVADASAATSGAQFNVKAVCGTTAGQTLSLSGHVRIA